MFQPQPTPFASSCFSYLNGVEVPDYSFGPTPLSLQALQTSGAGRGSSGRSFSGGAGVSGAATGAVGIGVGAGAVPVSHASRPSQHALLSVPVYSASSHASTSPTSSDHYSPVSASAAHNLSSYNAPPVAVKMEHANTALQEEIAAQEAAARDYRPQLEGPLVGDKTSSHAITEEYAKADQTYVEKTVALPQTYSHYRAIQGDGNCGWRAIAFSYFEKLIEGGDKILVDSEIVRITNFNDVLLNVGGYDRYLFEDMVEETITLLRDISNNLANPELATSLLMQKFNETDGSNAILYHMRLLASSWLKANPEPYEPFIPAELGIPGYCSECIERVDREIEHLGIVLLVNCLLKPLNFVLEIAYLDRSPGSQVNVYRFPEEANSQAIDALGPIIYLLYRPDHYDILYRSPVELQIHRATSFTHRLDIANHVTTLNSYSTDDFTALALIPGGGGMLDGQNTNSAGLANAFAVQAAPWMTPGFGGTMSQPPQAQSQAPEPRREPKLTIVKPEPSAAPPVTSYPLRFSKHFYKLDNSGFGEQPPTTSTFKNSHFNKAHYNNPNFQPEEWSPNDEEQEKSNNFKRRPRGKAEVP